MGSGCAIVWAAGFRLGTASTQGPTSTRVEYSCCQDIATVNLRLTGGSSLRVGIGGASVV